MRRLTLPLAVAASLLAAGCQNMRTMAMQSRQEAAAALGLAYARQSCAGCHEIGASGASPVASAPAFGDIHRRLTGPALESELDIISTAGHHGMAPIPISTGAATNVTAYIDSLGGPAPK